MQGLDYKSVTETSFSLHSLSLHRTLSLSLKHHLHHPNSCRIHMQPRIPNPRVINKPKQRSIPSSSFTWPNSTLLSQILLTSKRGIDAW
jgi:hypothetical protein